MTSGPFREKALNIMLWLTERSFGIYQCLLPDKIVSPFDKGKISDLILFDGYLGSRLIMSHRFHLIFQNQPKQGKTALS